MRNYAPFSLALFPLALALWGTPPEPVHPVGAQSQWRLGSRIADIPSAPTVSWPVVHVREPSRVVTRPTWPEDWPNPVPVRVEGANGIQTMGSGSVDVVIPGMDTFDTFTYTIPGEEEPRVRRSDSVSEITVTPVEEPPSSAPEDGAPAAEPPESTPGYTATEDGEERNQDDAEGNAGSGAGRPGARSGELWPRNPQGNAADAADATPAGDPEDGAREAQTKDGGPVNENPSIGDGDPPTFPDIKVEVIEEESPLFPHDYQMPLPITPENAPQFFGGPSGRDRESPVELLIRSKGGSTGPVMELFGVNSLGRDVRIHGDLFVLEPVDLDQDQRARADEIMEAASSGKPLLPPEGDRKGAGPMPFPPEWAGANVVRVVLDGYCLEMAKGVPTEGTFFRIADAEKQAANAPMRAILASSRALREAGALHPDSDPDAYFHSIRQWAIWVEENGLDRAGFEKEFIDHTRRNFEAAGREWSESIERRLGEFIPNRWNDVVAILEGAGRPVPGEGK